MYTAKCDKCQKEFTSIFKHKKFCSKTCYSTSKKQRFRCRNKAARSCVICSKIFMAYDGDYKTPSKYCSTACIAKAPRKKKFLDIPSCLEDASKKIDKTLGYVRVYAPMHKEANTWGYVYEHRVVAEQIIGRSLEKDEIVHHKNGKRWDNRPENLEVMNKNDHAKLHGQRLEDLDI